MKVIDLSQELYDQMPVYPGDPEVHIQQIHDIEKEGWRLRYLQFSSHIGTHTDAFSHMDKTGISLSDIPIERFIGKTFLVNPEDMFPKEIGLAFMEGNLDMPLFEKLQKVSPLFIIVGNTATISVELERALLNSGIVTITDLVNMEKLPKDTEFMFYGVPLKIRDGDGSPIRAFAVIN